jgi:hypothetical protein
MHDLNYPKISISKIKKRYLKHFHHEQFSHFRPGNWNYFYLFPA